MMEQAMPHMAVAFAICLGTGGRVNVLAGQGTGGAEGAPVVAGA